MKDGNARWELGELKEFCEVGEELNAKSWWDLSFLSGDCMIGDWKRATCNKIENQYASR